MLRWPPMNRFAEAVTGGAGAADRQHRGRNIGEQARDGWLALASQYLKFRRGEHAAGVKGPKYQLTKRCGIYLVNSK
jgi:hypothetical protein